MHAPDDYPTITIRIDRASRDRELSTLFSQIVTETIIDVKDLALSVTLGLDGEFHQIVIRRDCSNRVEARGHTSIHA